MSDEKPKPRKRVPVEFGHEFSPEEAALHLEWREPTPYERSILTRLLEAEFPERTAVTAEAHDCQVRQIDRCGCIEFRVGAESDGDLQIVAEGRGPSDEEGVPLEIMLTLQGGHLLWLEFTRYGGRNDFRPDAELFEVLAWNR